VGEKFLLFGQELNFLDTKFKKLKCDAILVIGVNLRITFNSIIKLIFL